jgi:hypothetical protein
MPCIIQHHSANAEHRHLVPRQRFKVTNWREFDTALRERGSLTVLFTKVATAACRASPQTSSIASRMLSHAIAC